MNDSWEPPVLRARLERVVASKKLDGLEIEFWTASGAAPPARRSQQLRLLEVDGCDTVEFARTKPADEMPLPLDRFRVEARPEDIASFAQLLLSVVESAEPSRPLRADPDITRISVHESGRSASRTWYARPVPDLGAIVEEASRLATLAVEQGRQDVVRFTPG